MLHWLVFEHFQWGTAESTESTLSGRKSTLRSPVVAVKVHVGILYADYTTPLPNALVLPWPVLEHFQWGTAERKAVKLAADLGIELPM